MTTNEQITLKDYIESFEYKSESGIAGYCNQSFFTLLSNHHSFTELFPKIELILIPLTVEKPTTMIFL